MRVVANILAHILSLVVYPLFVPTYGIALFCYAFQCPMVWSAVAIIGTVLLTCVLPMTAIGIMIHKGKVKDIQISNAAERTLPYLYSTIGFVFWSYLIGGVLESPLFLTLVAVGATVALGIVTIINRYWKISAHLTGIGGLVGGIMTYCLGIGAIPTWGTLIGWMLLSLVMMFARLRLDAHTPAQVCAGWLIGIACTFIPYCIYSYVA